MQFADPVYNVRNVPTEIEQIDYKEWITTEITTQLEPLSKEQTECQAKLTVAKDEVEATAAALKEAQIELSKNSEALKVEIELQLSKVVERQTN